MAEQVQSGLDRIISLPDDILCHIISFLPAKDAVRTCILSKRWRYLFASISSLDFDFENNWEGTADAFMNFVDRVLLLNKRQSIDRFRLHIPHCYRYKFDQLRVEGWIHSVLGRSIEEINLSVDLQQPRLPASLFTCKRLVVLKLSQLSLQVPASVHLPRLKVFHLKSCVFDDDFGEWLSTGCPVLEQLVVDAEFGCPLDPCKLNVSNSMLKRLTIQIGAEISKVEITINAPSLVYLQYYGYDDNRLAVINVPSLTEASIYFCPLYGDDDPFDYRTFLTDLMKGISNIHALSISYATLDELPDECESIDWRQLEESRLPLLSHLKTIEIFSFKGGKVQLEIIKYFLKNARVLKNLTIYISKKRKVQSKMVEEIRMFPRILKECQITIL